MRLLKPHTALICAVLALAMTACVNDDTVDGPVDMPITDLVQWVGNADGATSFKSWAGPDGPTAILTAAHELSTDTLTPGDRVLLTYLPPAGPGGDITLRGINRINNGRFTVADTKEIDQSMIDPVYVYSLWRMGGFINLHCRLVYSTTPRRFGLVVSEATVGNDYPDVYLVHALPESVDYHDRAYYASWDIDSVWQLPSCKGLRIHVNNSNLDKDIFTFNK